MQKYTPLLIPLKNTTCSTCGSKIEEDVWVRADYLYTKNGIHHLSNPDNWGCPYCYEVKGYFRVSANGKKLENYIYEETPLVETNSFSDVLSFMGFIKK